MKCRRREPVSHLSVFLGNLKSQILTMADNLDQISNCMITGYIIFFYKGFRCFFCPKRSFGVTRINAGSSTTSAQ